MVAAHALVGDHTYYLLHSGYVVYFSVVRLAVPVLMGSEDFTC
jgi:hypothetical protein